MTVTSFYSAARPIPSGLPAKLTPAQHHKYSLHPDILSFVKSGHLSALQARLFSLFEHPKTQWRLLQTLGHYAHNPLIIDAILRGDSVIELPDGDAIILPSRKIETSLNPTGLNHAA